MSAGPRESRPRQRQTGAISHVWSVAYNLLRRRRRLDEAVATIRPQVLAQEVREGNLRNVERANTSALQEARKGPRGALKELRLADMGECERQCWTQTMRLRALLGDWKSSMASFKSGLRCYFAFLGTRMRFDAHEHACSFVDR